MPMTKLNTALALYAFADFFCLKDKYIFMYNLKKFTDLYNFICVTETDWLVARVVFIVQPDGLVGCGVGWVVAGWGGWWVIK